MSKLKVGIASILIIGASVTAFTYKIDKPTALITETTLYVPVTIPSLSHETDVAKPVDPVICIEHPGLNWPIAKAVEQWNKNSQTLMQIIPSNAPCKGRVLIEEQTTKEFWGRTTPYFDFGRPSYFRVTLSTNVPVEHRLHVICHELGHVLGAIHSEQESCMSVNNTFGYPSTDDLNQVRQTTWSFENSSRQIHQN